MKKRITLEQWEEIGGLNYAPKWLRPYCDYYLTEYRGCFRRVQRIKPLVFLVLFIPLHLVKFFDCLWNEGLSEFFFESNEIHFDVLMPNTQPNKIAKKIWESA